MARVLTGLDVFKECYWKKLKGLRLGLLSNQASLDCDLTPAKTVISRLLPGQLRVIFGPQHGHGGEDQDNMIETEHAHDSDLNIPIFSLYSKTRRPSRQVFEMIDMLIIDLQDVGTRVYTFASTMVNCLEAAAQNGKRVLILDRPNPLGGEIIEGNLLKKELFSFVGAYKLPIRHGLTMGELAQLINNRMNIDSDLDIVPMRGWRRSMLWNDTEIRWVMPSPNMPFPDTAFVYPGQVIWEATNISEGRGTCRPFEMFGSPFLDTKLVLDKVQPGTTEGCHLQEISFRPTFQKWKDTLCKGFMIHILDRRKYNPYFTSLSLLKTIFHTHGDSFQWKRPPYEYEYEKMPIDMILGDSLLRIKIEAGEDIFSIRSGWISELEDYLEWRKSCLIYD